MPTLRHHPSFQLKVLRDITENTEKMTAFWDEVPCGMLQVD